jgi:hypothetical protein
VMNSPRCNAAQNTCTFSLIMCLKNLATNTLIPTVLRPLQEPAGPQTDRRYCQDLWMGLFQAASISVDSLGLVGVISMGRSSTFPLFQR